MVSKYLIPSHYLNILDNDYFSANRYKDMITQKGLKRHELKLQ